MQKDCRALKKNEDKPINAANAATEEHDALLLSVDGSFDSWVIDSGASFHTTAHRDVLENYVAGNYGKVYLADGEPLDIVGIGDAKLKMPNGSV